MNQKVNHLLTEQLANWEMARSNYAALHNARTKELKVNGIPYKVQFNPARLASSGAKIDAQSISRRQCFLCSAHLPEQQQGLPFEGHYTLLVNPFPIFPRHLTIPEVAHVEQRIAPRFRDMLTLARELTDYTIFYNGPQCGASAPDHAHFQAGNKGFLPIETTWRTQVARQVAQCGSARLFSLNDAPRTTFVMESASMTDAAKVFEAIYRSLPIAPQQEEPMMNVLALYEDRQWICFIFPRHQHRPHCYTAEGEENLLSSPASVDLGGVFIVPLEKDFLKIDAQDIAQILSEVCLPPPQFEEVCQRIKTAI